MNDEPPKLTPTMHKLLDATAPTDDHRHVDVGLLVQLVDEILKGS